VTILLKEMAEVVPGAVLVGNEEVDVTGIEYHSKLIKPGSAFVAISGFVRDGNDFADEAIKSGAVAVVTEKEAARSVPQMIVSDARAALADLAATFYTLADRKIKVCGVTGTNGKTTSCFLIKNILEARGKKVGLINSLVYDTGSQKIAALRTTPESLDIFRLLYAMKKNLCVNAVIEISSHALALHRVKNIDINVALFTNFTRDHLDFHHDMDDYLNAKATLLDKVCGEDKWAIINYDCPEFRGFIERVSGSYMTYSLRDQNADVYLQNYQLTPDGSRFEIHTPMGGCTVNFRLPGRFNLYNALAATAAAMASGADIDAVVRGLESSTVVPGRLERVESDAPFSVFIDYAHTPDALKRTIEALNELGRGRVLTLFGCGGDRDRGKRPLMGEAVTSISDYAVLTSDNSRSEKPQRIFEDVKPGFVPGAKIDIIEDRREAIAHILKEAHDNDVILLAGKGDENYQEIGGVKYPWSDRDVAKEQLHKLGFGA
jgi:UDP-N-acetylmuramoyl-L-alanyl-D-glutamate--2,6-diaminopimelate ligase